MPRPRFVSGRSGHISVCQLDIRVAFETLRHDLIGVTGTGCRQQEVESAAQAVRGAAVASGYLCGFCPDHPASGGIKGKIAGHVPAPKVC